MEKQISAREYTSEGFIKHYQELVTREMIPYQYKVLHDEVPGIEKSHVIQNFKNAASVLKGGDPGDGFYGFVFQDSDLGKWIEAAAYSLINSPDPELEKSVDDIIDLIGEAQDTDGYLNTYFTIKDQDKRMQNLHDAHELYSAGHLMEAAAAYYEATGKKKFLDIMTRNAEYMYNHFIVEKHPGYPGHPEVELALVKIYQATGNEHALELSKYFIDVRGVDPDYFYNEDNTRGWEIWHHGKNHPDYNQAHKPFREQKDAVGHAVRNVYLCTGAAKIAGLTKDKGLYEACKTLWDSITNRRMYITGGIGSSVIEESFTVDYDLPSDAAYAETCASIGLMFFGAAMLENELDSRYADIMEQAFYNTAIAGMQLDGKQYFYVNPLEAVPGISGETLTKAHVLPVRPGWYACACCPPNVARAVESFGKYAYGENDTTAFCHMYAAGKISLNNGIRFTCETGYPYDFKVRYTMETAGKLAVRIPGWSCWFEAKVNGMNASFQSVNGYIFLDLQADDVLTITFCDDVRVMRGNPRIPDTSGRVAFMRGPLVYCLEGADNEGDVLSLYVKRGGKITTLDFDRDLLSGIVPLEIEGYREKAIDSLYTDKEAEYDPVTLKAIPYYTWANRGANQMRVWIPVKE